MEGPFVSRAGLKLERALAAFHLDVRGLTCADLGSCTGGFTDCLLQNGAAKVYAVDTGYGALEWKLRKDPRVVTMEKTNALHVELPEPVDFISIDVGWTRQKLILPHALTLIRPGGHIVSLLKTHYEAQRAWLYRGTVKPEYLEAVLNQVDAELKALHIHVEERIPSPLTGDKGGNAEYLLHVIKPA